MKVRITRGTEIVIETEATSINIDENGYVDFYTPEDYYYTTTQGRNPEDNSTTLWIEMFEEDEDDEAEDMAGIPFNEVTIYIDLAGQWIEVPKQDIFKDK